MYNTYLRAFFHNLTARVVSYAVTTYVVSVKSGWFWVVVEEDKTKKTYMCIFSARFEKGQRKSR